MFMAEFFYREHYRQHMSKNLTDEQKKSVIMRISDLTLESAIWLDRETDYKQKFPELAPFVSSSAKLSGLYLVAIMKEIFQELNPESAKNIGVFQRGLGK